MASRRVRCGCARRVGLGQDRRVAGRRPLRRGSSSSVAPVRHGTGGSSSSCARRSRNRTCGELELGAGGRPRRRRPRRRWRCRRRAARARVRSRHARRVLRAARKRRLRRARRRISSPTRSGSRRIREDIASRRTFSFCPAGSSSGGSLPRMRRASSATPSSGASRSTTTAAEPPTPRASRPQSMPFARLTGLVVARGSAPCGRRRGARPLRGPDGRELPSAPRGDRGTDGAGELRRRAVAAEAARRDARLTG